MGWICISAGAADKQIRLRNALITTAEAPHAAGPLAKEATSSGLYLIQFKQFPNKEMLAALEPFGVRFLRYVPEDAYVVRLDQASISGLRAQAGVQWVGGYASWYKVYEGLRTSTMASGETAKVRVLLTPDASDEDLASLTKLLGGDEPAPKDRSRRILHGQATAEGITALSDSPAVLWIEPEGTLQFHDEISTKIVAGAAPGHASAMQAQGFDGQGVTIAVADSGLDSGDLANMHPDLAGRVDALFYYGQLKNAADLDGHGTHVSGIIAANGSTGETDEDGFLYGLGVAPGSHLVGQRIVGAGGSDESPANKEQLTRDAWQAGARIMSNSWGSDTQGRYDTGAAEFDALVRDADSTTPGDQAMLLVFSAGNAGPGSQTISSPASAKNVIAVGASMNNRPYMDLGADSPFSVASMSSRGPCEDGRLKPDLVAPGTLIASLQSQAAGWSADPISHFYQYMSGTSQACPQVAGAAAVFIQYYRHLHGNNTPSPALIKAALINSALDMNNEFGTASAPNKDEGWGRVDMSGFARSNGRFEYVDQTATLSSGQVYSKNILVAGSSEPLKITMAYTDVPGLPATLPALVNDLDLEVTAPDGILYRGNQIDQGESMPNPTGRDALNNVEMVTISHPAAGQYTIRVKAVRVAEDARRDTPEVDQDFALAISADLPRTGEGVVILDRSAYTAPSQIRITLIDFDLAGQAGAQVSASAGAQGKPLLLSLKPANGSGVFTGSVATVKAPMIAEGALSVRNGDNIQIVYQDSSPEGARSAHAVADTMPPVISDISVTRDTSVTTIEWKTDKPATGLVRYTTNQIDFMEVSSAQLAQTHSLYLEGLPAGATNYFEIAGTDAAGNTVINDNQGLWFSHVVAFPCVVLLVDDYAADDSSPFIPVSAYTEALDQIGITCKVWTPSKMGGKYPTLEELKAHKILIWRVNDSFYSPNNTILPEHQQLIQSYLNGGGSLFIASMELLSRLNGSLFVANTLQAASFHADVGVPSATGVNYDIIGGGLELVMDYTNFPSTTFDTVTIGPDLSDTLEPTTNAAPILIAPSGKPAGLRYPRTGSDSNGRVVFLAFPFEAIRDSGYGSASRSELLLNIVSFLAPGINGLGSIALDSASYAIPSLMAIEISDSDLAGKGRIEASIYSDFDSAPRTIGLDETVRPGLFRGYIPLVAVTNEPSVNQLRAQNQDNIVAEYYDSSSRRTVRAHAVADTSMPAIASLSITPAYNEVKVEWTTSKPSDSLVQYGESRFLGQTIYNHALSEKHSLVIKGLAADRQYFCQIVCRDEAGNRAVDNNDGQFYAFRTLKPYRAPWQDQADPGDTNKAVLVLANTAGSEWQLISTNNEWAVMDSATTEAHWQFGPPANGRETNAIGSTNCWGSNLNGMPIAASDTALISPAIELKNGNFATLTFFHSFDFTPRSDRDWEECGLLFVSTNNGASWIKLAKYTDVSDGWQKTSVDLTPYMNRIVRIKWEYVLDTLDQMERPAWLMSGVSIEVSLVQYGSIYVSNNLSQASFSLSGPAARQGQGNEALFTGVPAGQYVLTFNPVPYYVTPAPQTNTLVAARELRFEAAYGMVDLNSNSIPDAWEQEHFGAAATNAVAGLDSDQDGASDLAEFVAQTDPVDPSSFLRVACVPANHEHKAQMQWQSVPGMSYRVEFSDDLQSWQALSGWIRASGTAGSHVFDAVPGWGFRYFRIAARP